MPGLDYAQHVFAMAVSGGVIFLIAAGLESVLNTRHRAAAEQVIERLDAFTPEASLQIADGVVELSGSRQTVRGMHVPRPWIDALANAAAHIGGDMLRHDLQVARLDREGMKRYSLQVRPAGGCIVLRSPIDSDSLTVLLYKRDTRMPRLRYAGLLRRKWPFPKKDQAVPELALHLEMAKQESTLTRLQFLRLAHDLRMPLSTILLLRDRLLRELSLMQVQSPGITDAAERLVRQVDQLRLYLDSLLAIESGQFQEGDPVLLSPGSLLLALKDSRSVAFEKREIRVETLEVDSSWNAKLPHLTLQRTLDNLLANALRFTPPGGVVRIGSDRASMSGRIWIEDSGPGLSPADFEEYVEMGRRNLGRSGGGHGIGLAAAFEMARAMGGRLSVESPRYGSGARFLLVLPAET